MEFIDLPPMLQAAGSVRLPGSKSISNRVLLLAAQWLAWQRLSLQPTTACCLRNLEPDGYSCALSSLRQGKLLQGIGCAHKCPLIAKGNNFA